MLNQTYHPVQFILLLLWIHFYVQRFECDPSSTGSDKQWAHWLRTSENFISAITTQKINKFTLLINYVAPSVYEYIADCNTYESAITILKELYVKPQMKFMLDM